MRKEILKEWKSIKPILLGTSMLIFGLVSFVFGLGLFLFKGQLLYSIANLLISISGLVYIMSSISLFRLNNWSRRLIINCSTILLFYFIPLSIALISDPWGWGKLIAPLFLPYILFPLLFLYLENYTKPKRLGNYKYEAGCYE